VPHRRIILCEYGEIVILCEYGEIVEPVPSNKSLAVTAEMPVIEDRHVPADNSRAGTRLAAPVIGLER
jgi:hypothetical protein